MVTMFDWPVGSAEERIEHGKLPGAWIAATQYAQRYSGTGKWAIHTGLDLNLNTPKFDADAHSPVYAAADGNVVFAGHLSVWGHVIVCSHLLTEAIMMWTRYAHVEAVQVKRNDHVTRGQQIARVGNADGRYPYHLHYDIARVDLGAKPWDWPGDNRQRVLHDYIDPMEFVRGQLLQGGTGARPARVRVEALNGLRVREKPDANSMRLGLLLHHVVVELVEQQGTWGRIVKPIAGWINLEYTSSIDEGRG